MLEEEIKRWIKEMESNLEENNDVIDSKEYKKVFDCMRMSKDLLKFSIEELDNDK